MEEGIQNEFFASIHRFILKLVSLSFLSACIQFICG